MPTRLQAPAGETLEHKEKPARVVSRLQHVLLSKNDHESDSGAGPPEKTGAIPHDGDHHDPQRNEPRGTGAAFVQDPGQGARKVGGRTGPGQSLHLDREPTMSSRQHVPVCRNTERVNSRSYQTV
eukprot:1567522-Rhodomonas_salina.2